MANSHCDLQLLQILNHQAQLCLWIADENTSKSIINQAPVRSNIEAISNRYDIAELLRQRGFTTYLNDFEFDSLSKKYSTIVFPICKERSLANHCINWAFKLLDLHGELILIGEKNQGIKTHAKNAATVFGCETKAKKLGSCYVAKLAKSSEQKTTELDNSNYSELRAIESPELSFLSKPGIFGWNKIDQGSAFLVEQFQQLLQQTDWKPTSLLDLGCGYGYLTLMTSDIDITHRYATDNNAAAVKAARANFKACDLEVTTTLDDCGKKIDRRFDLILCNPPFHSGFLTSTELTVIFLQQSARMLESDGMALWVLNKFIEVENPASKTFQHIEIIAENNTFKVIRLRQPIR